MHGTSLRASRADIDCLTNRLRKEYVNTLAHLFTDRRRLIRRRSCLLGGPVPALLDSLMIHASTDIPMPSVAAISRYFFPDRSTACTSGVFHQFWYRRAGPSPACLDCLMIELS